MREYIYETIITFLSCVGCSILIAYITFRSDELRYIRIRVDIYAINPISCRSLIWWQIVGECQWVFGKLFGYF